MESIYSLQGNWMIKLDLQDAHLIVPVHRDHQNFLHFTWKGQAYQFQTLPFGLGPAPLIFTKLHSAQWHSHDDRVTQASY